jgi:hypothetical protein
MLISGGMRNIIKMKNKFIFLLLGIFMLSFATAQTYTLNEELDIKIICINDGYCSNISYCNINIIDPDSILNVTGENMTYQVSFYNYTITPIKIGEYKVGGFCIDGEYLEEIDFTFDVTQSGGTTPEGFPAFQGIFLLIIFGTACFLLYLSIIMHEKAFKIFFLITSLVFLMATMLSGYMISSSLNVSEAINSTTLSLIVVLGIIIFIVFIYILIRQTINALDMYRIKRGREWSVGAGSKVAGYNTKSAY